MPEKTKYTKHTYEKVCCPATEGKTPKEFSFSGYNLHANALSSFVSSITTLKV